MARLAATMKKKPKSSKKPATLAELLRHAIEKGPKSRYQISQETGVPQNTLSRFVNENSDIRLSTIDALLPSLELELPKKTET